MSHVFLNSREIRLLNNYPDPGCLPQITGEGLLSKPRHRARSLSELPCQEPDTMPLQTPLGCVSKVSLGRGAILCPL